MDAYFPWILLASGAYLKLALLMPNVRQKLDTAHPIPGSVSRMNKAAMLFLIVGALWGAQDLLIH